MFPGAVLPESSAERAARKTGFSKKGLEAALNSAGIDYRHHPELGNPADNRDAFRAGDPAARDRYKTDLSDDGFLTCHGITKLIRTQRVALLCYEAEHDTCHRSCVVEICRSFMPRLKVVRL